MAQKVFVTGGSGFVGREVVRELLGRGHQVGALVRDGKLDLGADVDASRVRIVRGDLFDPAALGEGMRDADAVVHLVGIIMERPAKGVTFERIHFQGTKAVVDAAKTAGVKRYVQMSALGTRADAVSDYHKTK